jgi:sporulation protein YlmC with PRC-barrel domain
MPLTDLVRLQEIIDYEYDLIDKKVIDTTKKKLGKVNDYVVETGSFKILKFSVKRPLLASFNQSELIIHRSQIRKVTANEIIVSSPTAKDDTAALVNQQIENPFRGRAIKRQAEQPSHNICKNKLKLI